MGQVVNGNSISLGVSDAYVRDSAQQGLTSGSQNSTNTMGQDGTGSWGPLDTPILYSTTQGAVAAWGPITAARLTDPHDLVSAAYVAFGAADEDANPIQIYGVRRSDGTDAPASYALKDTTSGTPLTGLTMSAKWTGVAGNSIKITIGLGAQPNSFNVTILPFAGGPPQETYVNLPTGEAFWPTLQTAINQGQYQGQPSNLVVAGTPNGSAIAPAPGTFTLTGGTDGRGVTTSQLVGNSASGTGVYALSNLSPACSAFHVVGLTDSSAFANLLAFNKAQGMLTGITFSSGSSTSTAVTAKQTDGIDDPNVACIKDWVYWQDPVNNVPALIDPLAAYFGLLMSLDPSESPGNKFVSGISGTDRTTPYLPAELGTLQLNGITVITPSIPAGAGWGVRHGQSSSSNPTNNMIAYARMTNYAKLSIAKLLGPYVEKKQSTQKNDKTRAAIEASSNGWATANAGDMDYLHTQCDMNNNSVATIQLGYCYVNYELGLLGIIKWLVATMQAGVGVTVVEVDTPGGG